MILKNPNELIPYILKADRGNPDAPVFWYKLFTIDDYHKFKGKFISRITKGTGDSPEAIDLINENEVMTNLFEQKVFRITNIQLPGEAVKDIEEPQEITKLKEWMQWRDVLEVTTAIQAGLTITEDEAKK